MEDEITPRIKPDEVQLNIALTKKLRTQLKMESVLQETPIRALVHRYIVHGLAKDAKKRLEEQEEELAPP